MDVPPPLEVEIIEPATSAGEAQFLAIEKSLYELERMLRSREAGSKSCKPLYFIRWGLAQVRKRYMTDQPVCSMETKYDEYMKKGVDIPE